MNKKIYIFFVVCLIILAICGIYNFFTPIKKINNDEKNVFEGKIVQITKEYNYNDNSEYIEKYVAEVLTNKNDNEHITITLNKEDLDKYKENDKINYYEDKGNYYITEDEKTPTNGGFGWLVLSGIEIGIIIFLCIKIYTKQ